MSAVSITDDLVSTPLRVAYSSSDVKSSQQQNDKQTTPIRTVAYCSVALVNDNWINKKPSCR